MGLERLTNKSLSEVASSCVVSGWYACGVEWAGVAMDERLAWVYLG